MTTKTNKVTFSRMVYDRTYHGKPTEGRSEIYCNGEPVGTIYSDMCEETFVRCYGVIVYENEHLKPGCGGWDDIWRCGEGGCNSTYVVPREPRAALALLKKEIKAMFA